MLDKHLLMDRNLVKLKDYTVLIHSWKILLYISLSLYPLTIAAHNRIIWLPGSGVNFAVPGIDLHWPAYMGVKLVLIQITMFVFRQRWSCILGEGNGNPLQYSCLENPRDGGAVYGAAESQAWLKRLSSSSSSRSCIRASLVAQAEKNPPAPQESRVWSLGQENPLENRMATHSSILAWGIPCKRT